MKKNTFYLIGFISLIISLLIDNYISLFFSNIRNNAFDFLSVIVSYINTVMIFALMTLILYFINKKKEIILMWIAFFSSGLLSLVIKLITNRTRPFIALNLDKIANIDYSFASWNTSFLSWHTAALFTVYPFLDKKIKYYWLIFAFIITINRVYTGFHYLSDLIAGALLGHMTIWIIIYLNKRFRIL